MRKIFILFILAAFVSSCIPGRYIEIESLQPAESGLSGDAQDILVLNGSYLPGTDTSKTNQLNYLKEREQFIIDTIIINRIFNGLFFVFDQSPNPVLNSTKYVELRVDDTTAFLKPYDLSYINELCDTYGTDHVISFEYYSFNLDKFISYYTDYEAEKALMMRRKLLWRLYEKDVGLQDEFLMNDTLYWTSQGYDLRSADIGLPEYMDVIKESFWYAGYDYAKRYSPYWESEVRSYFSLYNKRGNDISLEKDELLELFREAGDNKTFRVAYNLALVSEMEDDLDAAIKYIEIALSIKPASEYALYYKRKLEKKQSVYEEIEQQLEKY